MKNKHILVVSQYFYPEQFRINDICEEWVERGYKVTVVTGIPNYPEGKFYKGYNWFKNRKETYRGINIIRVPLFARGKSSIGLVLNYFSFVFFGWFFSKFTRLKADYVFTYEVSPIFQAKVGIWFAKRRKIKSILYVMDLWPENLEVVGGIKNKAILKWVENVTKKIYKQTDLILTSSKSFIESIELMNVPREKIDFWPQYSEEFYANETTDTEIFDKEFLNLTFTGNIGKAQGLDILVGAAEILKEKDIKVKFNIVGDGRYKETLLELINNSNVTEYFNFVGRVPATKIPSILKSSDAALLTLLDNPVLRKTIPAKLQSYLASGIPILTNASGEVNQIIKESNSGLVSESGDVKQFTNNIIKFIELSNEVKSEISNNAKQYAKEEFDKNKLMNKMDEILIKIGEQ